MLKIGDFQITALRALRFLGVFARKKSKIDFPSNGTDCKTEEEAGDARSDSRLV